MEQTLIDTYFAPAERASLDRLQRNFSKISSLPFLTSTLEAMPHIIFVLNKHRQIVFTNHIFYDAFGINDIKDVLGLRPGEAVNCEHSGETLGGCGTTKYCMTCGAVGAILNSLKGNTDTQECRIVCKEDGQVLDLNVKASPLDIDGQRFVIVSAVDISHEKRRRILERVFFHDVMNTVTGLKGVSDLLSDLLPRRLKKMKKLANYACQAVSDLIESIRAQKDLTDAEKNDLMVEPAQINSLKVLQQIEDIYKCHPITRNRSIVICPSSQNIEFESDVTLLKRCIGNLTKNAIEASGTDDVVTIGCTMEDNCIQFWVHNSTVIPEEVQNQIFQRSFSTKGKDRGLGTYSIRLLTEKYLNGSISFTSNVEDQTVFKLSLPLSIESADNKA